ncbi:uncharacterized protein LOC132194158 [Neocloeon triangulifer]|uniref:uncharacterized protein LOC132194158 n=1 Tax=Neocloeon triangulifer TaxID=2078957 RepID=UPI00286F83A0|nr:uncharacterized protein LOC132194158 [Neocloeon triangulifer]
MSAKRLTPFVFLLLLYGWAEAAHPPKQTGPCSWVIDTVLRPTGIIQTPNFPHRFTTPARCRWVLNSSQSPETHTIIWFTQIYVLTGLRITEQLEESSSELAGSRVLLDASAHDQLLNYTWVRSAMPYLVVELNLDQLEGNHVRTRDNLLDVFGFNMTYELVRHDKENAQLPKRCSVVECSYAGDCLADASFTNYGCACYNGFSGDQCQFGPLCNAELNPCLNGGICRHMTVDAVLCTCTDSRFYGPLCEFSNVTDCEQGGLCEAQCTFDGNPQSACKCGLGAAVPVDRARYETTLELLNKTHSRASPSSVAAAVNPLDEVIAGKLLKFLRSTNLTRVEDVKVVKIIPGVSLTFSFISAKNENQVLLAMNSLIQRGRLGPFELKKTSARDHKKEPALFLESVRVNRDRILHVGDEFIVSCLAQGSTAMEFRWFKDGIPVNESLALRDMEQTLLDRDSRDMYTALLRVSSATPLDEGNYTCQVVDREVQQCKSLYIEVASPPIVTISPMSVTLSKGENLTIFCMSSNDKRSEKFGFNWTKNNALLPTNAGREMMEDLHPDGSLLRIYNAHQSATYACHVQSGAGSSSAKIEVSVTSPEVIPLCRGESLMGVQWPHTTPGQVAMQPCPVQQRWSTRAARRTCTLYETGVARWQTPDFSECVSAKFENIRRKFRLYTLGYAATTPESTMRSVLIFLDSHKTLLPGEGEPVLDLLSEVHDFLRAKPHSRPTGQTIATCRAACQALNMLLEHPKSISKPARVGQLQQLMRKQTLLWGSYLGAPSSAHLDLSSVLLDIARLTTTGTYKLRYPLRPFDYPGWFTDKLDVRIQAPYVINTTVTDANPNKKTVTTIKGQQTFTTATDANVTISVIVYRSIANFLPERYVSRLRDGDSVELQLNSRVLTIAASRGMKEDPSLLDVELELESRATSISHSERHLWNATCASFGGKSWTVDACQVTFESDNITRCRCFQPGTYAAMLAMHAPHKTSASSSPQLPVAAGCAFCLVLSAVCCVLLTAHICLRNSCLVFLKLQAAGAVLGATSVFLFASTATVPQGWSGALTTILESCLLVGLSSPLSTLMLVYTEVVQMRPSAGVASIKHLRQTVVSVITGLPVVAVFCSHLAHSSTSPNPQSVLLLNAGSARFNIFVACTLGMALIFLVVHGGTTRRLHVLETQNSGKNKAILRRIGLLKRATAIFAALISVIFSSLLHINLPSRTYQFVFSLSCVVLGITLIGSYIIKSETPLKLKDLIQSKKKKKKQQQEKKEEGAPEFSSESLDSPLRLFLRPDVTHGNESGNPGVVLDAEEVLANNSIVATPLDEGRELLPVGRQDISRRGSISPNRRTQPSSDNGTIETYVQPDCETSTTSLDRYSTDMQLIPQPQPGRCYIPSDGLIVQVCVEPEPLKGYVPMAPKQTMSRAIPVAPPCVPDITFSCTGSSSHCPPRASEPIENPIYLNHSPKKLNPPRVTFSGCDTVQEVDLPPPPPPQALSESKERKQPEGREISHQDNVEGMLDRISHDLDYLLSRSNGSGSDVVLPAATPKPAAPLRSALKKTTKSVKIREPSSIIFISSDSCDP